MITEEINMKIGDLVIAVDVGFEGDPGLTAGAVGIVKRVEHGNTFFNPEVLIYWTGYDHQSWEHPDAVKVISSIKK